MLLLGLLMGETNSAGSCAEQAQAKDVDTRASSSRKGAGLG